MLGLYCWQSFLSLKIFINENCQLWKLSLPFTGSSLSVHFYPTFYGATSLLSSGVRPSFFRPSALAHLEFLSPPLCHPLSSFLRTLFAMSHPRGALACSSCEVFTPHVERVVTPVTFKERHGNQPFSQKKVMAASALCLCSLVAVVLETKYEYLLLSCDINTI